jgi:hypothetical protein
VAGLSFETLVVGGLNEEVAKTIYATKAITDGTDGDVTITVDTLDGLTEDIKFTRPTAVPLALRVSYTPANLINLNATEEALIRKELATTVDQNELGVNLYNTDLEATVYVSLAPRRLKSLTIEVKPQAALDAAYSAGDFVVAFDEVVTLAEVDIEFVSV